MEEEVHLGKDTAKEDIVEEDPRRGDITKDGTDITFGNVTEAGADIILGDAPVASNATGNFIKNGGKKTVVLIDGGADIGKDIRTCEKKETGSIRTCTSIADTCHLRLRRFVSKTTTKLIILPLSLKTCLCHTITLFWGDKTSNSMSLCTDV